MSIKQTNITTNKKELEFNITFKYDIAGSCGYKMKGLYWMGEMKNEHENLFWIRDQTRYKNCWERVLEEFWGLEGEGLRVKLENRNWWTY